MQVVNAVRSLLTDPDSRAEYDQERISFLQAMVRPRPAEVPRPAAIARSTSPALARTARAAMAGMLVALKALTPGRCPSCDAPVEASYRFCGGCGSPL
jgi:curved DNA-binding protein CbpA